MQNSVIFQKRLDKGLALKMAAKKIGCSYVLLSMLEKGDVTHPEIAKRIQKFYKLTDEEYYQLIPKNYRPGKDYDPDKYKEFVPDVPKDKRGVIEKMNYEELDVISNFICVEGAEGLVENACIYDLVCSIRAAKFPMSVDIANINYDITAGIEKLAMSGKGEGHDNWLNGIRVAFDLTFSNKAWVEMERYHFIDFVSSQSTMHRIAKFDYMKSYNHYVDRRIKDAMYDLVNQYNADPTPENYLKLLYSNPAGFKLTARLTTNYRQLKTIYSQRKDHRLPEWREFCKWIETLPYSYLITGKKEDK